MEASWKLLLSRHYNAVVAADMSRDSIFGIFSTILDYFLQQGFDKSICDLKDPGLVGQL